MRHLNLTNLPAIALAALSIPMCHGYLFAVQSSPQQGQPAAVSPKPVSPNIPPEEYGDILMARQKYQAAIAAYNQVPGKSAVIWNKIGVAYQHLFALDQAEKSYLHALHMRRNYPEALNNLGTVYFARKEYREAEKCYKRAARLEPSTAVFSMNLGTVYFAEKKMRQGAEAYRAAFAVDPSVFKPDNAQDIPEPSSPKEKAGQYYCMAELFARAGMNAQAIDLLRKSFDEGFTDRKRLLEDRDFAGLRNTSAFSQLMQEQKSH